MYWFRSAGMLLALPLFAGAVGAQGGASPESTGDGRDWVLILSGLRDEDAYEHSLASFHLALREETWLSLTAGRSRAPSTEQDVRADLVALGIEHDFGPVGIRLSAERWGDRHNLESHDRQAEISFGSERCRLALTHERRAIDIYFSGAGAPIATDLRRVRIDADGLGLNWRFRLAPSWQTYGSWTDYDYPRSIGLVPRADRLDLLSNSAVTLAYSFIDRYSMIGLEYSLGQKQINLDYGQDRSTIDGERLKSIAASVLWPIAPRMDLEFRLGSSRAGGFGSTLYGGLTLLIYGGG